MQNLKTVNIGLVGYGTVGKNVHNLLLKNTKLIEEKISANIRLKSICDINKEKLKKIKIPSTTKWQDIVNDKEIDIVVELIGGEGAAKEVIVESLKKDKHIVTANKQVLAKYWDEIFGLANEKKKLVYFEASVCAGIPVIQALNEGLAANEIKKMLGILNGTTNLILTHMEKQNMPFNEALKVAQEKGFAEADPKLDVSGEDTLHKTLILSSIAWNGYINVEDVYKEGIENIDCQDIIFAKEFGYKIKLLGMAKKLNSKFEIQVRPVLISQNHVFSNVENEYNAVFIEGDACKDMIFYGKGAGGEPAASAVVSDIIFLSRQVATGVAGKLPYVKYSSKRLKVSDVNDTDACYYLRFTTVDKPGVLAKISNILGKNGVSIACVYQKEPLYLTREGVPIVMLTHQTREKKLRNAIKAIDNLDVVRRPTVFYKIEG